MLFGDGSAAAMAAADAAKNAVRSTANFNWTFIALLAVVIVGIWIPQWKKKNYNGMAAALALYGVHWLYEIANAVICHFSGYALWHVSPESTSFILLVGVSWELSLMFSVAGFMSVGLLPEDKTKKSSASTTASCSPSGTRCSSRCSKFSSPPRRRLSGCTNGGARCRSLLPPTFPFSSRPT